LELNFWVESFSLFSIFDLSLLSRLFAWLLGILLELLFLYTVEFIYQVAHQLMLFLFSIFKIQKKGILHWLAFMSWNLYHYLSTISERLHFTSKLQS
jgi:hypothetical protein